MLGKISRFIVLFTFLTGWSAVPRQISQAQSIGVQVLDAEGTAITRLVDGSSVRLRVSLSNPVEQNAQVIFRLAGLDADLANCQVAARKNTCESEPVRTLGWHWNPDGTAAPERIILAYLDGEAAVQSQSIRIEPRPVVMVHGFSSDWRAWQNYLGASGYLAELGLAGFAVGDGQVSGVMNTGSLAHPLGETNTIAENAAILGEYIQQVKASTGAAMVDLVAHSMGGLISRYYIARVMQARDVAQLIMLGSPMAGTECAYLPSALGFYLPAVLEIRPSYVTGIFNQQINDRKGVPFRAVAGVPIINPVQSPCTGVPSDIVISRASISAIPLDVQETSALHIDLNASRAIFLEDVSPLLKTPPGAFRQQHTEAVEASEVDTLQFSQIFSGHVNPGETAELVIPIDEGVTVARFALYDSSRSLTTEVRGASGNVIELSLEANGLVTVDDPAALFYLGYGFANPKPGEWRVTLQATEKTPAIGADYALTAAFEGGAVLQAETDRLLTVPGRSVRISARLESGIQGIQEASAQAVVRSFLGGTETIPLLASGEEFEATWKPKYAGLHAIDLSYTARLPDGSTLQRSTFLTVDVQPTKYTPQAMLMIAIFLVTAFFSLLAMRTWLKNKYPESWDNRK